MAYDGPDPGGFMAREEVVDHVRRYAATIDAPVRLGTGVRRLAASDGHLEADTGESTIRARNVVLATGPYPRPKTPAASEGLAGTVQQLHSHDYRRPDQLADGAVLVAGSGQSGAQIAEELHPAGRDVHLAVSMCPRAPRRYRGRDVAWWLLQLFEHSAEHGIRVPTVDDLPSPAATGEASPHIPGCTPSDCPGCTRSRRRCSPASAPTPPTSSSTSRPAVTRRRRPARDRTSPRGQGRRTLTAPIENGQVQLVRERVDAQLPAPGPSGQRRRPTQPAIHALASPG
jgi:hypothetical protein